MIDVKGTERQMILKIVNQADGTAAASLTNVNEGLDIPIAAMTQTGAALTLDLKAINGSYAGTMNAEHTELTGTFTQGPASLPMTFRRNR